jgi:hypothetical protein
MLQMDSVAASLARTLFCEGTCDTNVILGMAAGRGGIQAVVAALECLVA